MATKSLHSRAWTLARRQHGVIARRQLLELGFSTAEIRHRIDRGRLHRIRQGVFAAGRPELTKYGRWMAAVLSCGPEAALSHGDAAALYEIRPYTTGLIHLSVPARVARSRPGIVLHRRAELNTTSHLGIPVTTPAATLIDLATQITKKQLEAAVNEADARNLTTPEQLRSVLDEVPTRPGVATLRRLLDRRTFRLTRSELERIFLPLARRAGLSVPLTRQIVNGFEVDFYWPDLGLVVETDSLTYHRTPAQQGRDRLRDQAHMMAGLIPLRFTHEQVFYDRAYVEATLAAVALRSAP